MKDYTPKIAKADLIHGAYYRGRCRNADTARWCAVDQQFYHWRNKFGHHYIESIKHPEDDKMFDVFIVEEKIPTGTLVEEIVLPSEHEEEMIRISRKNSHRSDDENNFS